MILLFLKLFLDEKNIYSILLYTLYKIHVATTVDFMVSRIDPMVPLLVNLFVSIRDTIKSTFATLYSKLDVFTIFFIISDCHHAKTVHFIYLYKIKPAIIPCFLL